MRNRLDSYKIFYEAARCSSFSMAAQALFISQSAISQAVRGLEDGLGTQLFVRSRRGIRLTREGELLYQKVESAMNALEQGETMLARLQQLSEGSLHIAAGDTITSQYLLPYIEQFHAAYPDIRIEMANSYSEDMLKHVRDGKAELAFVNLPASDPELIIEPCLSIHDIFVCGPDQLAAPCSWEDVSRMPLILLERNSTSRRYIDTLFAEKGIELAPEIEFAAYDLLIRFASIHLGVSCVIEEFSREALDAGLIQKLPLTPEIPARSIGCAYLKQGVLSSAASAFLAMIRKGSD